MWLIFVLFSLFFLAGIEIFYKLYIDRNPKISTLAGSIPANVFMIIWALPFFLFAQAPLIQAEIPWSLIFATNLFYIAGVMLYYESYKVISASIGTILDVYKRQEMDHLSSKIRKIISVADSDEGFSKIRKIFGSK